MTRSDTKQLDLLASEIRTTAEQTAEAIDRGELVPDLIPLMLGWAEELQEIAEQP